MPTFEVREWWAENRTTRNAFYHAISIACTGSNFGPDSKVGNTVQIMHYGSMKVAEGDFSRPVRGGQTKVTISNAGQAHSEQLCNAKMSQKRIVGYGQNERNQRKTLNSLDELDGWLLSHLGATTDLDAIRRHFGIDTTRNATDDPVIDPHYPILTSEDSPIEWEEARGTW